MTVVHQSVSTATTEESEEVCRQLFPTLRLSGGGALRHTHRVDGDERLLMARLTWSGPVSGRNTPVDKLLLVSPLSGKIVWEVGGEEGGFGVPWIQQPGQQAYSAYGPLDTVTASISMESLTATARAVYGDDDLEVRFTGATPTSAAMAKHIPPPCS